MNKFFKSLKANKKTFFVSGLSMLTVSRSLYAIGNIIGDLYWESFLYDCKMGIIDYGAIALLLLSLLSFVLELRE